MKRFEEGDLVWKIILPTGTMDCVVCKWSINWEVPFKVYKVLNGNAYYLASLTREPHHKNINDKYLKKYFPTM